MSPVMTVFLIICLVLTLAYVVLMLLYRGGWAMLEEFILPVNYKPITRISIIIPARNEAENIGKCISSILEQNYPPGLFEVIVVDDHSEDDTAKLVGSFKNEHVKCISLADHMQDSEEVVAYKKMAIAAGIANSLGELIITTDADCIVQKDWLRYIAAVYEREHAVMIVGPVDFNCDKSIVQQFQSLDFMSMQGITIAAHQLKLGNMCNGANLAFSREAYLSVDAYKGIDHLASGDDYLLMTKMQVAYPGRITYLKSDKAIVSTSPQPDWTSFLQQRIRWASKSGKYNDSKLTAILILVYLFNLSFLLLAVAGFINHYYWFVAVSMLLLKVITELFFLVPVSQFYKKRKSLPVFPLLQPMHIAYIIVAGLLGFVGGYKWKGRLVR